MNAKRLKLSLQTGLALALIGAAGEVEAATAQVASCAEESSWILDSALFPDVLPDETLSIPLPVDSVRLDPQYGRARLHFERNDGQVDSEVKFIARGPGYHLFLTQTEAAMVLVGLRSRSGDFPVGEACPLENWRYGAEADHTSFRGRTALPAPQVLRMRLVGANPSPSVRGEEELRGKVNYFIGNDPSLWRTNIPTFARVRYEEVYPGIDLVYYGEEGQLEYDFIVAPGADPNVIALEFDGAEELKLVEHGDLLVRVDGQEVRWRKPLVYQQVNGVRREAPGTYRLGSRAGEDGAGGIHSISFQLASYDPTLALVIDPTLVYSTYLGGGSGDGREFATGIAADRDGNAYVTGDTYSSDFPTKNPIQETFAGGYYDAFVTKFSPTGELLYSTYLGGSRHENYVSLEGAIAVDQAGSAYVTGSTTSPDFPLANPLQPRLGGDADVFVTKLSPDGSRLIFSTYLGGTKTDFASAIAVDPSGHAYLAGHAWEGFPTTNALYAKIKGGAAFVAKLHPAGDALIYSTFLGTNTGASGIMADPQGNAYVCGYAGSIPVKNAIQPTHHGPTNGFDGFVAKINPDGSELLFSTFLGGTAHDGAGHLALGPEGELYIAFETHSFDFPTVKPFQAELKGTGNIGIVRMKPDGTSIVFSTYLGGQGEDWASGLAVDGSGNIYVAGSTSSPDFPLVDAIQSALPGESTGFLTVLKPDGSGLLFSSYFGPTGEGTTFSILSSTADSSRQIYLAGYTSAPDFPVANAFQPALNGSTFDAFVTKFSPIGTLLALKVIRSGDTIVITWPASVSGAVLESTASFPAAAWVSVPIPPVIIGDQNAVPVDIGGGGQFFRLRKSQ